MLFIPLHLVSHTVLKVLETQPLNYVMSAKIAIDIPPLAPKTFDFQFHILQETPSSTLADTASSDAHVEKPNQ